MKGFALLYFLLCLSFHGHSQSLSPGEYSGKYKAKDDKGLYGGKMFRNSERGGCVLKIQEGSYFFTNFDVKQYGSYTIKNNTIKFTIDSIYIQKGYYIDQVARRQYGEITMDDMYEDLNRDRSEDNEYFLYNINVDVWKVKKQWYSLSGEFEIRIKGNKAFISRDNHIGKWKMKLSLASFSD